MPDKFFSGGFRSAPKPIAGSETKRNFSRLGSEAPIPSRAEKLAAVQANIPAQTPVSRGLRSTNRTVPLSQKNAKFAEDFAREAKALATKRGLTGAQRRSQLGSLERSFKLRSAGVADDDPRAVAIRGLGDAANERGLSGLQRRLQGAAASELLSDTLGYEEDRPLTFDEMLDKKLGI
jgi:hypothetical protein